jgi:hypothetical protein
MILFKVGGITSMRKMMQLVLGLGAALLVGCPGALTSPHDQQVLESREEPITWRGYTFQPDRPVRLEGAVPEGSTWHSVYFSPRVRSSDRATITDDDGVSWYPFSYQASIPPEFWRSGINESGERGPYYTARLRTRWMVANGGWVTNIPVHEDWPSCVMSIDPRNSSEFQDECTPRELHAPDYQNEWLGASLYTPGYCPDYRGLTRLPQWRTCPDSLGGGIGCLEMEFRGIASAASFRLNVENASPFTCVRETVRLDAVWPEERFRTRLICDIYEPVRESDWPFGDCDFYLAYRRGHTGFLRHSHGGGRFARGRPDWFPPTCDVLRLSQQVGIPAIEVPDRCLSTPPPEPECNPRRDGEACCDDGTCGESGMVCEDDRCRIRPGDSYYITYRCRHNATGQCENWARDLCAYTFNGAPAPDAVGMGAYSQETDLGLNYWTCRALTWQRYPESYEWERSVPGGCRHPGDTRTRGAVSEPYECGPL